MSEATITTREKFEAADRAVTFKVLLDHFRGRFGFIPPEHVFRLVGVPHHDLVALNWLQRCECGECTDLVPSGELAEALQGDAVPEHATVAPFPNVTTSGLVRMAQSLRTIRGDIEAEWNHLAKRLGEECWDQAKRDQFVECTQALNREGRELHDLLHGQVFATRNL